MTAYLPSLPNAACRGYDPELFDDPAPENIPEVRAICAVCPERRACLLWGIYHEGWGVWGGLTRNELRAARGRYHITLQEPGAATTVRQPRAARRSPHATIRRAAA